MKRVAIQTAAKNVIQAVAWGAVLTMALSVGLPARAAEVGHYGGGLMNIRDFAMPEPGFYINVYNYGYTTDRVNDSHGDRVDTLNVGPRGGLELSVDVNVDLYMLAPTFIWVSKYEILGAKYGAFITPTFATASVGASLATVSGRGGSTDFSASFDAGDLFVQPLWLDWSFKHWDLALGYGVYVPVGRYSTETVVLPELGPITAEATDNIGLGFWTHQIQPAVTWYPWEHKGTAVAAALTYEIHSDKDDYDLTPGQDLTLNYGISQFIPLDQEKKLLLELGPAGYSTWQVTDDEGDDAKNDVHDQVHAAGGQVGLTYVPWMAALNLHYFYEYAAKDRFQGQVFGASLAVKF
jgi:hypothetical protein